MPHCWKDYREHLVETGREWSDEHIATWHGEGKTCMLEANHEGEHEWTDDDSIVVAFKR